MDYTIRYENNKAVGTAYVVLTGTGSKYTGSIRVAFKITGTNMSKVKVTGVDTKGNEYTGSPVELMKMTKLTITDNEKNLATEDYTVSYQKNLKKGTAIMVLTGIPERGYSGSKKVTFKINAKPVEKLQVELKDSKNVNGTWIAPYMKGGSKPEVVVTDGEKELVLGKEYIVSYKKNKKVGETATLTIKGKGNYGKTTSLEFMVVQKDVAIYQNSVSINALDKEYSNKQFTS